MPERSGTPGRPPSTTWGTFLRTHLAGTIAIDFLTVPTVTFNALYVFFVLSFDRRRILHVNATAHPHAGLCPRELRAKTSISPSQAPLLIPSIPTRRMMRPPWGVLAVVLTAARVWPY